MRNINIALLTMTMMCSFFVDPVLKAEIIYSQDFESDTAGVKLRGDIPPNRSGPESALTSNSKSLRFNDQTTDETNVQEAKINFALTNKYQKVAISFDYMRDIDSENHVFQLRGDYKPGLNLFLHDYKDHTVKYYTGRKDKDHKPIYVTLTNANGGDLILALNEWYHFDLTLSPDVSDIKSMDLTITDSAGNMVYSEKGLETYSRYYNYNYIRWAYYNNGDLTGNFYVDNVKIGMADIPYFTSTRKGNVFDYHDPSKVVTLHIPDYENMTSGQIFVEDAYGHIMPDKTIILSAGTASADVTSLTAGYWKLVASVFYGSEERTGETTTTILGGSYNEYDRKRSPLSFMTVRPEQAGDLPTRAGASLDRQFLNLRAIKRRADGDFYWGGDEGKIYINGFVQGEGAVDALSDDRRWVLCLYPLPDWLDKGDEPLDLDVLYDMMYWVASSMDPKLIYAIEVINEPSSGTWKRSVEELASYHVTVAQAFHDANPAIKVYGPTLANLDRLKFSQLNDYYIKGALEPLDGLAMHPYVGVASEKPKDKLPEDDFIKRVRRMKKWMVEKGYDTKPILFTEYGWATSNKINNWQGLVNELEQAQYSSRSLALLKSENIDGVFLFSINYGGWRLLIEDGTPKPGYAAAAQAMRWLAGTGGGNVVQTGSRYEATFNRAGDIIKMIWDTDRGYRTIIPGNIERTESFVGQAGTTSNYGIPITNSPLFVRLSGDGKIWLEAESAFMQNSFSPLEVKKDFSASSDSYITLNQELDSDSNLSSSAIAEYAFNVKSTGPANIWFRTMCSSGNESSFWVRIDGGAFKQQSFNDCSRWIWKKPYSNITLSAGSHTIQVASQEEGANLDKILVATGSSVNYHPDMYGIDGYMADHEIWLEAETAQGLANFSPFMVYTDTTASLDRYIMANSTITTPPSQGNALYGFNLASDKTVNVWLRGYAPNGNGDSFFVGIKEGTVEDAEEVLMEEVSLKQPYSKWNWTLAGTYSLPKGRHTLHIAPREGHSQLDKILITSMSQNPSD
ncbi:MAG: hypothetical protein P8163_13310 [Candidatus Thiodiazotropha sp.]